MPRPIKNLAVASIFWIESLTPGISGWSGYEAFRAEQEREKRLAAAAPAMHENPYEADPKAIVEGRGLYDENCAGCHGSPHAMVPSREASDNYQALQYQGRAKSIGSCGVCHAGSKGAGSGGFIEQHGPGGQPTACNVCHTAVTSSNTGSWPHQYQWRNR